MSITKASPPEQYQAIVIKAALILYAKTGVKVNRAYTPSAMLRTAERITGRKFKVRDYHAAIAALQEWIEASNVQE